MGRWDSLLLSHFVITQAIAGLGTQVPAPRIYAEVLAGAQLGDATAERGTKHALDRTFGTVEVDGRQIAVKIASDDGVVVNVQPEYEDVVTAAGELGLPVKAVLAAAVAASNDLWRSLG